MRSLSLVPVLLVCTLSLDALETDQFTLPDKPLTDIGPEVSARLATLILDVVRLQDTEVLDEARIADELHHRLSKGGPLKSELERFIDKDLPSSARFNPSLGQSIYRGVLLPLPGALIVRAPTVKVFGYELGADKLGHFTQQGYEYYKVYQRSPGPEGLRRAVAHGVRQEHTYFGTAVSGVYSNADLAANLAGLKFFLNLTHAVDLGGVTLDPILVKHEDVWQFSPRMDARTMLQPFVSEHWNEALNPSEYRMMHPLVAKAVRKRCASWRSRLGDDFDEAYFTDRMAEYGTWDGEDYGHRYDARHGVSLAAECFTHKEPKEQ